ncbi:hypothetical protein PR048_010725 [Dryococelus australis]|uniref:Uncharacterized protein n=1 Tax=Dryococelus australis TaxID=614101 RepID=A0ABQ9I3H8_9NEOP|nr:hypothetical protein PR048_010725 [Dryococelus australis]
MDQAVVSDRQISNTKREQKPSIWELLLEKGNLIHSDGDEVISHLEKLVAEQKEKILTIENAPKCCREEITDKKEIQSYLKKKLAEQFEHSANEKMLFAEEKLSKVFFTKTQCDVILRDNKKRYFGKRGYMLLHNEIYFPLPAAPSTLHHLATHINMRQGILGEMY